MFRPIQQRHVQDRLSNLRARVTGLRHWLMQHRDDMQATEVLAELDVISRLLNNAETKAGRSPQQRVADHLHSQLEMSKRGLGNVYTVDVLEDAWKIANGWPWNNTNNDWWSHRRIERLEAEKV